MKEAQDDHTLYLCWQAHRPLQQIKYAFKLRIGDTDHCFDFSFVHWFKESRRWNRKQWKQWYDHPNSKAQPSRFLFEKLEDLKTPQYVNISFFFPSEHNGIRWRQYKTFYCVRFLLQILFKKKQFFIPDEWMFIRYEWVRILHKNYWEIEAVPLHQWGGDPEYSNLTPNIFDRGWLKIRLSALYRRRKTGMWNDII